MKCLATSACSGCGACYSACTHHAITMREDPYGFLYPQIDESKCNDCGKCEKACPLLHDPSLKNIPVSDCLAVMAPDEIRKVSSSGGIFTVLAAEILDRGGIVYGAAFDDKLKVRHIGIERPEDLERLRGSKYIQSDTGTIFRDVRSRLKSGRDVLFTGCPCQVAGLLSFLGDKDYPNLHTADLICHGVPAQKTFDKYVEENFRDRHITKFYFRDKCGQWINLYQTALTDDGNKQTIPWQDSTYFSLFMHNVALRQSCHACHFAKMPRPGDLTIGDFWGIDGYDAALNDGLGTSVMLINNQKGRELYDRITPKLKLSVAVPLEVAKRGNACLTRPSCKHPLREEFMNNYDKLSLEQNAAHLKDYKFDCTILNFWWYNNYGAVLTGFALQQAVKRLGYSSVMVNNAFMKDEEYEQEYFGGFAYRFARDHMVITDRYTPERLHELNALSDRFLIGSDQIMRYGGNLLADDAYYLKFADYEKIKIAFSASFAVNVEEWKQELPEQDRLRYKYLLGRFDDISTRELGGVDICNEYFGVPAKCIIDPVFTLDPRTLDTLVAESSLQKQHYLLAYVLDDDEKLNKTIAAVAADKGLEIEHIRIGEDSIQDWLYLIKNADYVITDSFHGLCFSVIFNRPVRCLINKRRGSDRFISIQTMLNLPQSVLFSEPQSLLSEQEIDYAAVNARIESYADECMQHLSYVMQLKKEITAEGRKQDRLVMKQALKPVYEFRGVKRLKYKCKKVLYKGLYKLLGSQAYFERYQHYKFKLKNDIHSVNVAHAKTMA